MMLVDCYDAYIGLDRHWYVRVFGHLVYRGDWLAEMQGDE